jgi:hypothetical protein
LGSYWVRRASLGDLDNAQDALRRSDRPSQAVQPPDFPAACERI